MHCMLTFKSLTVMGKSLKEETTVNCDDILLQCDKSYAISKPNLTVAEDIFFRYISCFYIEKTCEPVINVMLTEDAMSMLVTVFDQEIQLDASTFTNYMLMPSFGDRMSSILRIIFTS